MGPSDLNRIANCLCGCSSSRFSSCSGCAWSSAWFRCGVSSPDNFEVERSLSPTYKLGAHSPQQADPPPRAAARARAYPLQQIQSQQGARLRAASDIAGAMAAAGAAVGNASASNPARGLDWAWRTDPSGQRRVDPLALQLSLLTRDLDERDYAALAALDEIVGHGGPGRRGLSQEQARSSARACCPRSLNALFALHRPCCPRRFPSRTIRRLAVCMTSLHLPLCQIDALPVHIVRGSGAGEAAPGAAEAGVSGAPGPGAAGWGGANRAGSGDSSDAGGGGGGGGVGACCAICLEGHAPGAVLRSLPCLHRVCAANAVSFAHSALLRQTPAGRERLRSASLRSVCLTAVLLISDRSSPVGPWVRAVPQGVHRPVVADEHDVPRVQVQPPAGRVKGRSRAALALSVVTLHMGIICAQHSASSRLAAVASGPEDTTRAVRLS